MCGRASLNRDPDRAEVCRGLTLTLTLILTQTGETQSGGERGRLSAAPVSCINCLPEVAAAGGDPRTLHKLVDGVVDTGDATHMWLAPWPGGGAVVRLFVVFDAPVMLR